MFRARWFCYVLILTQAIFTTFITSPKLPYWVEAALNEVAAQTRVGQSDHKLWGLLPFVQSVVQVSRSGRFGLGGFCLGSFVQVVAVPCSQSGEADDRCETVDRSASQDGPQRAANIVSVHANAFAIPPNCTISFLPRP